MGQLHRASRAFSGSHADTAARIQRWDDVHCGILAGAQPPLPVTADNFGIIHGDINPSNFHYVPPADATAYVCGSLSTVRPCSWLVCPWASRLRTRVEQLPAALVVLVVGDAVSVVPLVGAGATWTCLTGIKSSKRGTCTTSRSRSGRCKWLPRPAYRPQTSWWTAWTWSSSRRGC